MALITLPSTPKFRASSWGLSTNTRANISPFNKDTQTLELPGARWFGTFTLPRMTRPYAAPWQASFAKLRGMANRFSGYDPDALTPLGSALGTPLVLGAGQTGNSLLTDGWNEIESNLLKPGDYFEVNSELKMVTAAVTSDSNGEATIEFEPALRSSPADNAALTLNNPTCTMMLVNDDQVVWDTDYVPMYSFTFSAIENWL